MQIPKLICKDVLGFSAYTQFSCGVVPFKGNHVYLIHQRSRNHWGFPKGKPQAFDGSTLKTAQRQLKEETNLNLQKIFDHKIECFYVKHKKKRKIMADKTVWYYPAFVCGQTLIQPEEIIEIRLMEFEQAFKQLTFQYDKLVLLKALDYMHKQGYLK